MSEHARDGRDQFRRFFAVLFKPQELVEFRFIESWTRRGKRLSRLAAPARWIQAGQTAEQYDSLVQLAETERANVYFGVCPRQNVGDATDETIRTVRCLWADLDDVSVEEAWQRWRAAEIPEPSMVVNSGRGVHAYWLLGQELAAPGNVRASRECCRDSMESLAGIMSRTCPASCGRPERSTARGPETETGRCLAGLCTLIPIGDMTLTASIAGPCRTTSWRRSGRGLLRPIQTTFQPRAMSLLARLTPLGSSLGLTSQPEIEVGATLRSFADCYASVFPPKRFGQWWPAEANLKRAAGRTLN